jgi:hypothetical protein
MDKPFDAVQWMRTRRAQIDEEDGGLSWAERSRKTAELVRRDPLWRRIMSGVGLTAEPSRMLVHEDADRYDANKTSG